MIEEASNKKLKKRITKLLETYNISEEISYSILEKHEKYYCVIKYLGDKKWKQFWIGTGYNVEKGNLRKAKKIAKELSDFFVETVTEYNSGQTVQINNIIDYTTMAELNTTNFNPNKTTKADWDFYEYMEYWLYNVIQTAVAQITFTGYKRQVTGRLKEYFTKPKNRKKVKEIKEKDFLFGGQFGGQQPPNVRNW